MYHISILLKLTYNLPQFQREFQKVKIIPEFIWKKLPKSCSNNWKKKTGRRLTFWLTRTSSKANVIKINIVLTYEKTNKSMEINWKFRIWSLATGSLYSTKIDFYSGGRMDHLLNKAGKTGYQYERKFKRFYPRTIGKKWILTR